MKLLILFFILANSLFAKLTEKQIINLKVAYATGKTIKIDNIDFSDVLSSVMLNESEARRSIVGDRYRFKHYIYVNAKRININYTLNKTYVYKNTSYKVHVDKVLNPYLKRSFGYYQMKIDTARMLILKYDRLNKYKYLIKSRKAIAKLLLYNLPASSELAGMYLYDRYIVAKNKKLHHPMRRAVSAYNGGWWNRRYLAKHNKHLKIIYELKGRFCLV